MVLRGQEESKWHIPRTNVYIGKLVILEEVSVKTDGTDGKEALACSRRSISAVSMMVAVTSFPLFSIPGNLE